MSNQETPRRRRLSVWWGVVLGLALGLFLLPVLALPHFPRVGHCRSIGDAGSDADVVLGNGSVQHWQRSCRLRFWGVSVN